MSSGSPISGSIVSENVTSSSSSPLDASSSAESNKAQLRKIRKRRNIPTDPLSQKAIHLLKEARETALRHEESFSHLVTQLAPELQAAGVPHTQVRQVVKDYLGDIPASGSTIVDKVLRKAYGVRYVNSSYAHPHRSEPASGSGVTIDPGTIIDSSGNSGSDEISDLSGKSGAIVQNDGVPEAAPEQPPQVDTVPVTPPEEVTYISTIAVGTSNVVTYQPSGVDIIDAHADSTKDAACTSLSDLISMVGEVIKDMLPESPRDPSPPLGPFASCLSSSVAGNGAIFGNNQTEDRKSGSLFLFGL